MCRVCMDRRRPARMRAFGFGPNSSLETIDKTSSYVVMLSRVGELVADECWDVTNVRCPEDMYDSRLAFSRRFSRWRAS